MGRHTIYTQEVADQICERLAEGEILRHICTDLGISHAVVIKWANENVSGFRDQYIKARESQIEAWADKIVAEAEDGSRDTITKKGRDGTEYESPDNEWINRSRLRVDTYKWLMSKLASKKYGERVTQEHTGEGGGPVQIVVNRGKAPDAK